MNCQAFYVYFANPDKVYGPFTNEAAARKYAGSAGTVTKLTANEILVYRVRVVAPAHA